MLKFAGFWLARRASVSVEFALVAVFFLFPLFAGAMDFVEIFAAQSQANAALQSLYFFALSNPGQANSNTQANAVVGLINAHSLNKVVFPATTSSGAVNGALSYGCISATGVITASTGTCATGTLQTSVTYQVTSSVSLVLPLSIFGFSNPFRVSSSGTIQIQ
jgi:Flp pilus assembly protein TadG